MQKKLLGLGATFLLLAGCAGPTIAARTTVTMQLPTTVFVTQTQRAAASSAVATTTAITSTSTSSETAHPSSSAPTAGSKAPPVGSKVPFVWSSFNGGDEGIATLNTVEWTTEDDLLGGTPKNGAYLILDVTIETTKGTVSVNPGSWQAKDAEGRTYKTGMVSGKEPRLASAELPVGEKSRGFVAIDCPKVPITVQMLSPLEATIAAWSAPGK